jgi:hypothetical protein
LCRACESAPPGVSGDDGIADVTDLRRVFMAIKNRVSDPRVERGTW